MTTKRDARCAGRARSSGQQSWGRSLCAVSHLDCVRQVAGNWDAVWRVRLEQAEAALIYDDVGDHVQTWEARAHVLEQRAEQAEAKYEAQTLHCPTCRANREAREQAEAEVAEKDAAIERVYDEMYRKVRLLTGDRTKAEAERDEYKAALKHATEEYDLLRRMKPTEAELAALKAQNKALKCCGSCTFYEYPAYGGGLLCGANEPGLPDLDVEPHDSCRWTPSRWQPREVTP